MAEEVPAWVEHARGMLAFLQGNLDDALDWLQKFLPHAERRREVTSIVLAVDLCAFLYLRLRQPGEARQVLETALERFTPMGVFWPAFFHPSAAEAALGLDDISGAAEHCRQAETYLPMDIKPAQARLLRARGLVHAAQQSWSEAITLIRQAAELYEAIGQPYDRARCLEALADVYGRRGDSEDQRRAPAALQEATAIYRQIGADFEVRRLEDAAGATGPSEKDQ
jgi:tetratricopeptide (TPR) repeat protein